MKHFPFSAFALLVCFAISAIAWSGDKSSVKSDKQKTRLEKTETSPLGDIVIEHGETQRGDGEFERQIWLSEKKNPKNRFLLFEHGRHAEVLFSPNQQWLVINNFFISNLSEVLLYRKSDGIRYAETKDAEIAEKIWALCMKENKIGDSFAVGHLYAEALRWSSDSGAILMKMWGDGEANDDGNTHYRLEPWLCVFDIAQKEASADLRLMNRNVFRSTK